MTCGGVCCVVEGSTPLGCSVFVSGSSLLSGAGKRTVYGRFTGGLWTVCRTPLSGQTARIVRSKCQNCPA